MANPFRAKWLLPLGLIIVIIGGYAIWNYLSQWETTDDAQIEGHIHPVNARVGGTVLAVNVLENQHVKEGEVLAQLDTRDFEVAVQHAEAQLAEAEASVVGARANIPLASSAAGTQMSSTEAVTERARSTVEGANREVLAGQAGLEAARAQVRQAQSNAMKTSRDLERMKQLVEKDEISQQQYDAAVAAADSAKAAVEAAEASVMRIQRESDVAKSRVSQAQADLMRAQAEAEGAKTAPQQVAVTKAQAQSAEARVGLAKAALEQARLNLQYATVKAPVAGIVSKKSVEVGQVVQNGQPLMAIIPEEDVWVVANFKETQLAIMHPGQQATIAVDAYGGREYKAHVDSISSATGARFSLLPPENATGNYVKVVQRVPVKILIEQGQDAEHQLRPGMSVIAKVTVK